MTFTQFDKQGNRLEYNDYQPGMPWARPVNPKDFVVPWGTKELEDASWVAHRVVRLNSALKKDPKYSNTKNLEPQISMEEFLKADMRSMSQANRRSERLSVKSQKQNNFAVFNELWEIRDRRTGEIIVVTKDYDKFLRKDLDALQLYGLPFVASNFIPGSRSFWTTPQAYYLGGLQRDQCDTAVQAAKQRRINILKFLYKKGSITNDQLTKFLSGDVGAAGEVEGNPKDAITPFLQQSSFNYQIDSNNIQGDAKEMVGFSKNQAGEFEGGRTTAEEVRTVQGGANKRENRRVTCVRHMYTETIRGMNNFIFTFWTKPRGILQNNKEINFTGEELRGQYAYNVALSTKRNVSVAQRKVEALSIGMQFMQMGLPPEQILPYIIDAANDPAFEKLLSAGNRVSQSPAQPASPAGAGAQ
jgi:hypothetical protein